MPVKTRNGQRETISAAQSPFESTGRSPLPAMGEVARIGRDYFQVVGFLPPLSLFRVIESEFTYPVDIPLCQRVREGVVTGKPLPFPIFGEVNWGPAPRGMVKRANVVKRPNVLNRAKVGAK